VREGRAQDIPPLGTEAAEARGRQMKGRGSEKGVISESTEGWDAPRQGPVVASVERGGRPAGTGSSVAGNRPRAQRLGANGPGSRPGPGGAKDRLGVPGPALLTTRGCPRSRAGLRHPNPEGEDRPLPWAGTERNLGRAPPALPGGPGDHYPSLPHRRWRSRLSPAAVGKEANFMPGNALDGPGPFQTPPLPPQQSTSRRGTRSKNNLKNPNPGRDPRVSLTLRALLISSTDVVPKR